MTCLLRIVDSFKKTTKVKSCIDSIYIWIYMLKYFLNSNACNINIPVPQSPSYSMAWFPLTSLDLNCQSCMKSMSTPLLAAMPSTSLAMFSWLVPLTSI